MSWYSAGEAAAEAMAASAAPKRRKNFFTDQKKGESAVLRFLTPAKASFNYKRAFAKWVKGEKMLTSYDSPECPLVQHPDLNLQATFAWWIIDRRVLKFKDQQTNEEKEVGPRILYFADGQRTRKQLIAFEAQLLQDENEAREADGLDPLTLDEYNLTSYDLTVRKESKAPWVITAKRPRKISKDDAELVETSLEVAPDALYTVNRDGDGNVTYTGPYQELLANELAPLEIPVLRAMLGSAGTSESTEESTGSTYSYGGDEDDVVSFED